LARRDSGVIWAISHEDALEARMDLRWPEPVDNLFTIT
jgi:hypothetical protein